MSNELFPVLRKYLNTSLPKVADRIRKRTNAHSFKSVGHGGQGYAYDIGGRRILKLTKDKREALAMANVLRNPSKYVVHVYDVFALGPSLVTSPIYGIVQDQLKSPDRGWASFVDEITFEVIRSVPYVIRKDIDAFVERVAADRKRNHAAWPMVDAKKIAWLYGVSDYLNRVGIKFVDYHHGNIMKDSSGQHKLIDLGLSDAPMTDIPTYESSTARPPQLVVGTHSKEDTKAMNLIECIVEGLHIDFYLTKFERARDEMERADNRTPFSKWYTGEHKRVRSDLINAAGELIKALSIGATEADTRLRKAIVAYLKSVKKKETDNYSLDKALRVYRGLN